MDIALVNQPIDLMVSPFENSIALWSNRVAPHLAQKHPVYVYAKRSKVQKRIEAPPNLEYVLVPALPNRVVNKTGGLITRLGSDSLPGYASQLNNLDYSLSVALSLRQRQIGIVHIHNFTQFVPVIHAVVPKAKLVLHMNCEWLTQLSYEDMARRIELCSLVLGSSNYITQKIRDRFPQYADRCQTIYNGVDVDVFSTPTPDQSAEVNETKRFLFVGRVSPEKGVHDLIEAFSIAAQQNPHLELNLLGHIGALPIDFIVQSSDDPAINALSRFYEDDYGEILKRMVPENLKDRVHFLGPTSHAGVVEHYHKADVLVNPSYSESFGMSLVEAMACYKPVIATKVGGMVEIVDDGKTGLLVERGDVAALAEAMMSLAADDQRRQVMGEAGRQRVVSTFSWAQIAQTLTGYYEAL
ncbi:MAG: glycosyltransferase family 4 protein [Anaerolineae bacterium]|nr:glycosyltransferase family 4 protein [Anaerolineae bacterium]